MASSSSVSYTKTLTSDSGWCTTWEALSQYINNSEVKYSLREIWIGDPSNSDSAHFNYDEDSVDGYKDYIVTSEDAIYCNSNTTPEIAGKTKDELSSVFSHDTAYWDEGSGSTTFANNALLVVNNSLAGQDITFVKLDREGQNAKPLKGAEFTLYSDSNCENAIETVSSDSEGVVRFKGKGTGTYYFKETKAPSGYSYADNVIYKALVHGTNPKITKLGDASGELVTSVVNSYGAGVKITKLGGGTRGLANAKFKVTKDVESNGSITTQEVSDIVTDKDGVAWILGVVQGTYHVTEVAAPEGYVLPVNPTFTFTVETNEIGETTIVHDALDERGTFVEWEKESNSDDVASGSNGETYKLTVRNKALFSLPTSGGIGIAWVYIAGIALLALACKLYVRRCE